MLESELDIYRSLQQHFDKLPIGFPATNSGVEIRILKSYFSPGEAQIALKINYNFESVDKIYEHLKELGLSKGELEQKLDTMAKKGGIIRKRDGNKKFYRITQFAVGMYEHKIHRLTKEFLEDFNQYIDEGFGIEFAGTKIPQTRVVPVEKSVAPEHHIPTYEELKKIIEDIKGPISVVECVCRQAKAVMGEPCKQTILENCINFGDDAQYYIDNGWSREISKEEALEILRKNQEDGLIFEAGNSQKPEFICSCCGCCCGIISTLKEFPRPAQFVSSNYYAQVNSELCVGCGTCIDRCQMNAIKLKNDISKIITKKCVGCGNCVVTCPQNAINLVKKKKETIPPETYEDLYEEILKKKIEIRGKPV